MLHPSRNPIKKSTNKYRGPTGIHPRTATLPDIHNDLAQIVKGTLLYADDTTLINEDANLNDLEEKANHTVKTTADWFKANKLTPNAKNTS